MKQPREPIAAGAEGAARLFQRTLANWAADLLRAGRRIEWPQPDLAGDYRDRDWKSLYAGSVLDD